MAAEEEQEELQQYLDDLNKEMDDNEDEEGNVVLTIRTEVDGDDDDNEDDDGDAENNGTIIMDAEGNYYFQTSDKVVEVKPMKKESPVKKVPATIVTPSSKRKLPAKLKPSSSLKQIKLEDSFKKVIKKDKVETIIPNATDSLPSEIDENEQIYEFDENEQDPDDPLGTNDAADYANKGLLKPLKSTKTTEKNTFTCLICPYETNKKFLLSRHLKTHSDDRPFKCSVCERGFKTNASLMNHINTHLGNKPHACTHDNCEKSFTTSGELVRHVRYRHTHEKPHKCTECDYSSVEMSKLRRHMRCHTGERPYQCPHCTYASPDTFKLKRHLRTHTGEKPYECDICHARFTQSNSLKYHRLIHSVNDKPVFQCHLCPTTCGRKTDLRLHIKKLHSSDQPIPCKRCGKELPDRYSYKMHIKTHEGEKCYRCTYCPYASITQRHLESHMLIHTDTKPFICKICETTFRQKQLLSRHMKVYHTDDYAPPEPRKKDHKCPHCDKTFAFNGNLIRHMETHDPSSQVIEEKQKLRMGRMKRVQHDGTVVTINKSRNLSSSTYYENDDMEYEEEAEEQLEQEEVYDEEYDEYNEYNEEDVQYVYEDFETEDNVEEELGGEMTDIKPYLAVEMENMPTETKPQVKNVTVKKENDGTEFMSLEVDDGQGFMVIEVMPDDEEEVIVEHEQEYEPPQQISHNIINKNAAKASVLKISKVECTDVAASHCFGFEADDDEEDEETKGAIKLLQLIEEK